jgi:GT2 family glycosyltransferase
MTCISKETDHTTDRIGVVVLTYNSADVVCRCVAALKSSLANRQSEIVVVDNNSSDDSAEVVKRAHSDVTVIQTGANLGYARGNNIGGRHLLTRGVQRIAFVNPDVLVGPDTLLEMERVLGEYQDAGCVGGLPVIRGQISERCFRNKPTTFEKLLLYSAAEEYLPILRTLLKPVVRKMHARHFVRVETPQPVYAVSGACIMFPAAVYERIGGFDEATFLFQEEFIISERLLRLGLKAYACPSATYDHLHGHSVNRRPLWAARIFIDSEQHLLRSYYKKGLFLRSFFLVFRYLDWILNASIRTLSRQIKEIRRQSL